MDETPSKPTKSLPPLTPTQKRLAATAAAAGVGIAIIGFAGSYHAVSSLAAQKHFGWFAHAFPIGIDAGIVAFLALDLVLTWLRIPYPLLRQGAWAMTAATIAFNSATAWGDWLAVGMHAAIPILFVIVVEAARHAIGRIANIVADRFIESPPMIRWFLSPIGTYLIWRRMRVWQLPSYLQVIEQQRELRVFRAKLRKEHGRRWRRDADAEHLLVFEMARFGKSVSETLAMPEAEAEAQRKAESERKAEAARQAEAEAETLRLRQNREHAEAEARRVAEAETEARLAEVERRELVAKAEAEAELALIEQRRLDVEAEAELQRRRNAEEAALRQAEAEAKALATARERLRVQEQAQQAARLAAEAETLRLRPPAPRQAEARPEVEAPSPTGIPKPKPEPETANSKQPAQIGGRRARVEAEVEAVRELMRANGGDVELKTVIRELGLTQTTAWDRLKRAKNAA